MRLQLFALGALAAATACSKPFPPRACQVDQDCLQGGVDGFCLPSPLSADMWCAFPDPDCAESGRRWGIRAGDDLAEGCVDQADASIPDAFIADAGLDACIPVAEICDGLDSDCDGVADNGCPGDIATAYPWNGYTTGSVWATTGMLAVRPRRPIFRWAAATDAMNYQIQIEDSCTTPGFATCDFPSPELDATTTSLAYAPLTDLPVSTINPVGRRYYWHVRACNLQGCGSWTAARYLDVGRLRDDFNGDGYSDVIVGAWQASTPGATGHAYVYFGGPGAFFNTTSDGTMSGLAADDAFSGGVAAIGDVNGDGFADAAVGAPLNDTPGNNVGQVYIYFGAPGTTFNTTIDATLSGPSTGHNFGEEVAGAGDVNGDGYADLIVGQFGGGENHVYFGGTGTFDTTADATLTEDGMSYSVASAGDVNGDGFCDVLAGAPYATTSGPYGGRAHLYFGGTTFDSVSDWHADGELGGDEFSMEISPAGDVNADGFADIVIGAAKNDIGGMNAGRAYLYFGGPGMDTTADAVITGGVGDSLGNGLAGRGDVNNDGYDDVLVGASDAEVGTMVGAGRAYVYFGGSGTFDTTADGFFNGVQQNDGLGTDMALGDVNGNGYWDVMIGAWRGGPSDTGTVDIYLGNSGTTMNGTSDTTLTGQAMYDYFGVEVD
jgi:hypothetical protein